MNNLCLPHEKSLHKKVKIHQSDKTENPLSIVFTGIAGFFILIHLQKSGYHATASITIIRKRISIPFSVI